MDDLISRGEAIDAVSDAFKGVFVEHEDIAKKLLGKLPSAQPEPLTDDDFETIRIHLNAFKEKLCNQQRWKEAEQYQRIIDRFMAFASAQPEPRWIPVTERLPKPYEYCLWTTTDGRVIYHHCDGLFSNYIAWMPLPTAYERSEE